LSVFEDREGFLRQLRESHVVVVGFGLTGKAVARSLKSLGLRPSLVDTREETALEGLLDEAKALELPTYWGERARTAIQGADLVVLSPGVDPESPFLASLPQQVEWLSEIELAYRLSPCPIVAITGTNGKSTTTQLVAQILGEGEGKVLIGGNIGEPLIEKALAASSDALLVAEVSSFQLEGCRLFRPLVAVILNLTPDHLDRHRTIQDYVSAKARILQAQTPAEAVVTNLDDPTAREMAEKATSRKYYFSRFPHQKPGTFLHEKRIWWQQNGERQEVCSTVGWRLPGAHNEENLLAAVAVARLLNLGGERIAAGIEGFSLLEHTLEEVGVFDGLTYVNDSKGTNPAATARALEAMPERVVLIAGGSNKRLDFMELLEPVGEKVRCLITLGETGEELRQLGEKAGVEEIRQASDLSQAVGLAALLGRPGETVLFSPAAASFDMFQNYKERGQAFREAVRRVKK